MRFAVGGSWASAAYCKPRFTNNLDILAEFTEQNLTLFLTALPKNFYVHQEDAGRALRLGSPFNDPHTVRTEVRSVSSHAFPLGGEELDRAILLEHNGLSKHPTPFVTPEDILLAKLYWFQSGGKCPTCSGGI